MNTLSQELVSKSSDKIPQIFFGKFNCSITIDKKLHRNLPLNVQKPIVGSKKWGNFQIVKI